MSELWSCRATSLTRAIPSVSLRLPKAVHSFQALLGKSAPQFVCIETWGRYCGRQFVRIAWARFRGYCMMLSALQAFLRVRQKHHFLARE